MKSFLRSCGYPIPKSRPKKVVRTSETHPLKPDFVKYLPYIGTLGLTPVPGKQCPSRKKKSNYVWKRNLRTDLNRLKDVYGTDVLVCLMEPFEYKKCKVTRLAEECERQHILLLRRPIVDQRYPPFQEYSELGQRKYFPNFIRDIVAFLRMGKNVVICCYGGLGRTGLVAACCLVYAEHTPDFAIGRIRESRPGSIGNSLQENYINLFQLGLQSRSGSSLRLSRRHGNTS